MIFYKQSVDALINQFKTNSLGGLSAQEVNQRLSLYGPNCVAQAKKHSIFLVFLEQFKSPLIYVLLVAAGIIFLFGNDQLDAFIIIGVLLFNAILGTIQERRTSSMIDALKKLLTIDVIVIRDGIRQIVSETFLVPGDIVTLQSGQRVPADIRLIEAHDLSVDESILTGESGLIYKIVDVLNEDKPIAQQKNMVFKGTYVVAGWAKGVVVQTGIATQVGSIYASLEDINTDIPLKRELDHLTYVILLFILSICFGLFFVGLFQGKPLSELLVMLTALFICVVPEGLPVVLTLVLVAGAYRMAQKKVLVKNMQAVEALGRTQVIVIDKTGTLTRNEMMVTTLFIDDSWWNVTGKGYQSNGSITKEGSSEPLVITKMSENFQLLKTAVTVLNSAFIHYDSTLDLFTIKGDPTEAALSVLGKKVQADDQSVLEQYRLIYELPFSSESQYHVGVYECSGEYFIFMIGSPEKVISFSSDGSLKEVYDRMLEQEIRAIGVAYKKVKKDQLPSSELPIQERLQQVHGLVNHGMKIIALCGIEDAIRPEVAGMIAQARAAGLRIIMATGDNSKTALAVAARVGICTKNDSVVNGSEIEGSSDQKMEQILASTNVFSRVMPQHKLRIVKLLQKQGSIVAMTGDGVNDAPSLLAADLGIAMGSIGTEVAKQAADIVLLDDSFTHIITAIKEGRHIFYTLKRVILYFFTTNTAEILIVLFAFLWAMFLGIDIPLPLTAAQILWLNLVTDGFLDVGLSMEKQEKDLLNVGWLSQKHRLVDSAMLVKTLYMAIPMGIGSLAIFLACYQKDLVYARTITLVTMAMYQWFNAWNCRSQDRSLFSIGFFSNRWFMIAALFVLFLQMVLLYAPFMQSIFKVVPLSYTDWIIVVAVSAPIIIMEELRKFFVKKKRDYCLTNSAKRLD